MFYLTLNLSLLGSFFMCFAMYHRHKQIFIVTKQREKVLKIDNLYGIILIFIVPILYFLFGLIGVIFSFLTGSILAFLIYKNYHNYKLYIF